MKTVIQMLLGEQERYNLEQRVFNGFMLVGLFISMVSVFANFTLQLPVLATLLSVVFSLILLLLYIFSRVFGEFQSFSGFLTFLVLFLILPAAWITNGGSEGGSQYYFLIGGAVIIAFTQKRVAILFLIGELFVIFALLLLDHHYPELMMGHQAEHLRMIDLFIGLSLTTIGLSLFAAIYSRSYEIERKRAIIYRGEMEQLILIDQETGLFTQQYIRERLTWEIVRAKRYRRDLVVTLFYYHIPENNNYINRHYPMGGIQKQLVRFFKEQLRETEQIGCDEPGYFIIISPETDLTGGGIFLQRLKQGVEEQFGHLIPGHMAVAFSQLQWRDEGGEMLIDKLIQRIIERSRETLS